MRIHIVRDPTSRSAVTRLTLGYLGVIMTLSLLFSLLFYFSSTTGLDVRVDTDQSGVSSLSTGSAGGELPGDATPPPVGPPRTDTVALAREVNQAIANIHRELLLRLTLFNIAMLPLGAVLGRWLARRTLRPIHRAIDAQLRFASNASHELRTPLTIMQAELELACTDPRLTLTRARQSIKSSLEETHRLQTLADSLLLLARDETLPRSQHDTADIINQAVTSMAPIARQKHITLAQQPLPGTINVHSPSLVQAIAMLLDNAIKYSPNGSTVTVHNEQHDGYMLIHVTDQGTGIAKRDLPHIRERFYRADSSQPGHGLGLSIVDKIVREHGGVLRIDSQHGKGSTFTIVL